MRESEYHVLVSKDGEHFELAPESVVANGQAAARREFVSRNPSGVEKACEEGRLFLAAIPATSWHPTEVRVERPQPRIIA